MKDVMQLRVGDRVRAKIRVFDFPGNKDPRWHDGTSGPVHAEPGEEGVVVWTQEGLYPCVKFDRTGTRTDVTGDEVEAVS
jgi:hypothetical protein